MPPPPALLALALALGAGTPEVPREPGWVVLPDGDLFEPLLADPKRPQVLASAHWGGPPGESTLIGAIALGETIGLVRWQRGGNGDGVQLGVAGAVFAQFDLREPSLPLINADYTVGIPLSLRRGRWSGRARLHHQSSHLGDEYVLANEIERVNVTFEALELLAAVDVGGARAYGGGEWAFHASPSEIPVFAWHAGVDYRDRRTFRLLSASEGRFVAGIDLKRAWLEERRADVSVRAGLELAPTPRPGVPGHRRMALLAQFYDGYSPYGQFYSVRVRLVGFGIHFTL